MSRPESEPSVFNSRTCSKLPSLWTVALCPSADGTPPMGSVEQSERWVEVCTRVYEEVVEGRGGTALRSYAGVNPAEFFAVATEAFFDDPVDLRRQQPNLYAVLGDYYHQDPAARHR